MGRGTNMEGSLSVEIVFRWDGMKYRWYASYTVRRIKGNDNYWVIRHTDSRGTVTAPPYWDNKSHKVGHWAIEVPGGNSCAADLVETDPEQLLDSVSYVVPTTP